MFLVSSELRDGDVQYVRLLSEQGRDCTVLNPWPGEKVTVYREGAGEPEVVEGERFTLKTRVGEKLLLTRGGGG